MPEYVYTNINRDQPVQICEVTAADDHPDGDGAFFAQVIFLKNQII